MILAKLARHLRRCAPPDFVSSRVPWFCRQLMLPHFALPLTVSLRSGERFLLRSDPISDVVIRETFGTFCDLYFPAVTSLEMDGWILDAGAHHGVYTVGALFRYPSARVIAVEPDPDAVAYLRRNIQLNRLVDRVDIVEGAIGPSTSAGALLRTTEGSWGHRLVPMDARGDTVPVCTLTFDEIVAGRSISLVKTNCEGGEYHLIPQLLESGQRPRWIILFAHRSEGDPAGLIALLERTGYECVPTHSEWELPRLVCRLR